jgi:hypothetical protein
LKYIFEKRGKKKKKYIVKKIKKKLKHIPMTYIGNMVPHNLIDEMF